MCGSSGWRVVLLPLANLGVGEPRLLALGVELDVHVRSAHAAMIDVSTGELLRAGSGRASRSRSRGLRLCTARCVLAMRLGRPGSGSIAANAARGERRGDHAGDDTQGLPDR